MATIGRKSALGWFLAWLTWCLLVLWLSLTGQPPRMQVPLLSWDKLQHGGAYALLTLFAGKTLECLLPGIRRPWTLAAGFALAFGGIIEYLQYATARGRVAETGDLVADALGIGLVWLGAVLWRRWNSGRVPTG